MSRPSEINTKTMSVRVPMDFYMKFLQAAIDKKMSVSEYMSYKMMIDSEDQSDKIEAMKSINQSMSKDNETLKAQIKTLSDKIKSEGTNYQNTKDKAYEAIKTSEKKILELQEIVKKLQASSKELEDRLDRANKHLKEDSLFGGAKQF